MQPNWQPWTADILKRSAQENKPVLLDISAVWCHWCHVMDSTSYRNLEVVSYINNHFIPVKVDTDKRPDINERYNQGGWPTTAILDAKGNILLGATYVPPHQAIDFLKQGEALFGKKRKKTKEEKAIPIPTGTLKTVVLGEIKRHFDPLYGGFGFTMKFPHWDVLDFLLFVYKEEKEEFIKIMLHKTLDMMGEGEIFDKEGGGFYRYATRRNWQEPHYEKLLEDNAHAINVYLNAYKLFGEERYRKVAERTLFFLFDRLFDRQNNVFFGSQDADEDYAKASYSQRQARKPPFVDQTAYAGLNALAITALLNAAATLRSEKEEQTALRCLSTLLSMHFNGKQLVHYPEADAPMLLRDHIWLSLALLEAYQYTGDGEFLKNAAKIAAIICTRFFDRRKKVFLDSLAKDLPQKNSSPGENALVALLLMQLQVLHKKKDYKALLKSALKGAGQGIGSPFAAVVSAEAQDIAEKGVIEVTIIEPSSAMQKQLFSSFQPRKVIEYISEKEAKKRKLSCKSLPAVYVCKNKACFGPFTKSEDVEKVMYSGGLK